MSKTSVIDIVLNERVVAVIRLNSSEFLSPVVDSLVQGGMTVLEVTSNTPGYQEEIIRIRQLYPDNLIGAGTVTKESIANEAIKSGAQFLVSPNCNIDLIKIAHASDIPIFMGAFTPTEVGLALDNDADFIKLFPADFAGPSYLKSLKGPFDNARFMVTGGIGIDNFQEWFDAGADAVGVGGSLFHSNPDSDDVSKIQSLTEQLVSKIRASK